MGWLTEFNSCKSADAHRYVAEECDARDDAIKIKAENQNITIRRRPSDGYR